MTQPEGEQGHEKHHKARRVLLDEEDQIHQVQEAQQANQDDEEVVRTSAASSHHSQPVILPGFFSHQTTHIRKKFLIHFVWIDLLFLAIILGILSLYWGALASIPNNIDAFSIGIIDFDHGVIGNAVVTYAQQYKAPVTGAALQFSYPPTTDFANVPARVPLAVLNEELWVAIVIEPGASAKASVDPTQAVSVYFAEARASSLTTSIVLPFVNQFLLSMIIALAVPSSGGGACCVHTVRPRANDAYRRYCVYSSRTHLPHDHFFFRRSIYDPCTCNVAGQDSEPRLHSVPVRHAGAQLFSPIARVHCLEHHLGN